MTTENNTIYGHGSQQEGPIPYAALTNEKALDGVPVLVVLLGAVGATFLFLAAIGGTVMLLTEILLHLP